MMRTEKTTIKEIELLRQQLVETVDNKGYTDHLTIKKSQELDRVLNLYNYLKEDKPSY